jgi:O-antigen ligase
MKQTAGWTGNSEYETRGISECETHGTPPRRRLSFLRFLVRYPIFILAFGPPVFRGKEGIDITQGQVDIWSFLQAGLLCAVTFRTVLRLAAAESILIPKQIRSILKYAFFLGLLFLLSAIYSPSRFATAAYSVYYIFTWICVAEFIASAYRNPPDWVQCLFHLRFISFLLLLVLLLSFAYNPHLVVEIEPVVGVRFSGGAVASTSLICAVIAIISAYGFLYSLEPRRRSMFFLLAGLAGTVFTRSRAGELSLLLSLAILGIAWAKTGKRSAYAFISGLMASILLFGAFAVSAGGGRIWYIFNRGQNTEGIESASGRTEIWAFVIRYCTTHPWGMGYVDGFRVIFRQYYSLTTGQNLSQLGTAHNTFFDVLAGAGWLALAVYLIILAKTIKVAWCFAGRQTLLRPAMDSAPRHAVRCALVLLIFCLGYGMAATEFSAPLRGSFYILYIIIAIILGASAGMIAGARARSISASG